jgi:hypothetical protein
MVTTGGVMEIHVYLVDGAIVRFLQRDPETTRRMLLGFQPARLYKENLIIIGDRDSLTAFPTYRIARIDLVLPETPVMEFPLGVAQIQEVTKETYLKRDAHDTSRRYIEIEMNNAPDVYLEMTVDIGEEVNQIAVQTTQFDNPANFMSRVFGGHGLYVGRFGGGVTILNPAHFTRVTIHPDARVLPPDTMPAGVWEASLLP